MYTVWIAKEKDRNNLIELVVNTNSAMVAIMMGLDRYEQQHGSLDRKNLVVTAVKKKR